jgi:hypothetical protein
VRFATFLLAGAVFALASDELFDAARKGDVAAVKVALDNGAPVDAKWRYDQTALFIAAFRGHAEVVKLLLDRGAKADVKDSFYGMTALGAAGQKGSAEIVGMLLDKGATADDQLLRGAVLNSSGAVLQTVIAKGKWSAESLSSALTAAEAANKTEAAELLKAAGAVPKPVVAIGAVVLAGYAGQYKGASGPVRVDAADGKLVMTTQGQKLVLRALDQSAFEPVQFPGTVKVVFRREGSKVTGIELTQGGSTQFLPREVAAQ